MPAATRLPHRSAGYRARRVGPTRSQDERRRRCHSEPGATSASGSTTTSRTSLREQGKSEDLAEEIAARTVNKERARAGESRTASRSSTDDISSGRRGGLRSHRGAGGRTRAQLYNEARHQGITGRSKMNKAELERAVDR